MEQLGRLGVYPFTQVQRLLDGIEPGGEVLDLTVGEPKMASPSFLSATVAAHDQDWQRYPPTSGIPPLREAITRWLVGRYGLKRTECFDVELTCGSREGIYLMAMLTRFMAGDSSGESPWLIGVPNPGYAVYAGSARIAGAEVLPIDDPMGMLPSPATLAADVLRRLRLVFLCSPGNPSGQVMSRAEIAAWIGAARTHGFVLVGDECYSELYLDTPPPGLLEVAEGLGHADPYRGLVVLNSLSKRSSAAGLRSALMAGDPDLIAGVRKIKAYAGNRMPLALQQASVALWSDEAHVAVVRRRYQANYRLVHEVFGQPIEAGMFLWLKVAKDNAQALVVTQKLWQKAGIKVLPGTFLCEPEHTRHVDGYIRIALVHETTLLRPALGTLIRQIDFPVDSTRRFDKNPL